MEKETKEQLIKEMMMGPSSNSTDNPTFILNEKDKKEEHEDVDPIFDGKIKNEKISEKYKVEILKEAEKNPNKVKIDTPDGRMSIKEAIEKGYDPKTGKFIRKQLERPSFDKKFQGKGLSPQQSSKMKQSLDPRSFNVNDKEGKRLGFSKGPQDGGGPRKNYGKYDEKTKAPYQQAQPNKLEALLGGAGGKF